MLLSGKFGAVIAAIPLPIIAAVYCVLFAFVGMYDQFVIDNFILKEWFFQWNSTCKLYLQYQFHALHCCFVLLKCLILSDLNVMFLLCWTASAGLSFLQFCNLNSNRSMFIVGFSLFIGLSIPQYFNEYLALSGHGPVHTGSTSVHKHLTKKISSC